MITVGTTGTCDRHRDARAAIGVTAAQPAEARDHTTAAADGTVKASVFRSAGGGHGISIGAEDSVALRGKSPGQTVRGPSIVREMPLRGRRTVRIEVKDGSLLGPRGVVAERVTWCVTLRDRLRGVLGREPLAPDEAYVIAGSRRVHTVGVPYDLDAVFCDESFRVLHVQTLGPRSKSKRVRRSLYCIELLGGRAAECGIVRGVSLEFVRGSGSVPRRGGAS